MKLLCNCDFISCHYYFLFNKVTMSSNCKCISCNYHFFSSLRLYLITFTLFNIIATLFLVIMTCQVTQNTTLFLVITIFIIILTLSDNIAMKLLIIMTFCFTRWLYLIITTLFLVIATFFIIVAIFYNKTLYWASTHCKRCQLQRCHTSCKHPCAVVMLALAN